MKISAIIPAYNAAQYITEALDSVLAQTYPVYEIIVVDDGSTDGTAEIVKEIASSAPSVPPRNDVPIKYIYQENKGPAATRNRGIKEATGDYMAFLDADDLWLPEKIEKQVKLFDGSDYAMVYCDMSHEVNGRVINKSYLKERNYKYVSDGKVYKNLLRENFIFTPTVIMKKDIIDKIGYFDEGLKICEDYKMWLNVAKNYPVGFANEPLVTRRRMGGNITEDKKLFMSSGIALFKELFENRSSDKIERAIISAGLSERLFNLGYFYWDTGDLALARENFLQAMRYKHDILKIIPYVILSYFPHMLIKNVRHVNRKASTKC